MARRHPGFEQLRLVRQLGVAFTGHNYENADGIGNLYTMLRWHILAAID